MAEQIYLTEVTEIGVEVPDFLETGLMILFESGAPPELAEISVQHTPTTRRDEPPEPGDVLLLGESEFRITAVGYKAWQNVTDLGHAVFKFDGQQEPELPGQIHLDGPDADKLPDLISPGLRIEIRKGGL